MFLMFATPLSYVEIIYSATLVPAKHQIGYLGATVVGAILAGDVDHAVLFVLSAELHHFTTGNTT